MPSIHLPVTSKAPMIQLASRPSQRRSSVALNWRRQGILVSKNSPLAHMPRTHRFTAPLLPNAECAEGEEGTAHASDNAHEELAEEHGLPAVDLPGRIAGHKGECPVRKVSQLGKQVAELGPSHSTALFSVSDHVVVKAEGVGKVDDNRTEEEEAEVLGHVQVARHLCGALPINHGWSGRTTGEMGREKRGVGCEEKRGREVSRECGWDKSRGQARGKPLLASYLKRTAGTSSCPQRPPCIMQSLQTRDRMSQGGAVPARPSSRS